MGNASNANSAVNANNSGISKPLRHYEVQILVQITSKIKKGNDGRREGITRSVQVALLRGLAPGFAG
jgi:hypothetical protein